MTIWWYLTDWLCLTNFLCLSDQKTQLYCIFGSDICKSIPFSELVNHFPPQPTAKCLKGALFSSVIHHRNCLYKPILFLHWTHMVNLDTSPVSIKVKRSFKCASVSQSIRHINKYIRITQTVNHITYIVRQKMQPNLLRQTFLINLH